jgi:uncharacterized protein (UPF0332 family)
LSSPEAQALAGQARTELGAARALEATGFGAQAIVHAYYACFFAAEGAILALGETRSKHAGVISAFGQLVVKAGTFDRATAATLRRLFELRNNAVYDAAEVDIEVASSAIADAERFLVAVEAWLKAR